MKLEDYSFQLSQLLSTISATERTSFVRDPIFTSWVKTYNSVVSDLNNRFERSLPLYILSDERFTASMKTIKTPAVINLKNSIMLLRKTIDDLAIHENDCSNRFHCFKIDHQCPHTIDSKKYLFFVGMPFSDQYVDSYQYGIKDMLARHEIDVERRIFKADEQPSTIDILCKICKGIQESQYIIINISGRNPNVMFELGLAYGLNKTVFLIKDENSAEISDLKGLEYTQYSNAADLANKLQNRFRDLGII